MTHPKIAILFPVYNPGPELEQTLASLRAQTVPARLYLIDDGSKRKPDYKTLLQGMDHRLIEMPKNLGITGALNVGLAEILKSDCEYVARLDNGDINEPHRFERQITYLTSHPELALVGSHVRFEYTVNNVVFDWRGPTEPDDCVRMLRYNAPLIHPTIMMTRRFVDAFKAYSEDYPAAEDLAMEFWAAKHGFAMGNVPENLYRTIELEQSISGGSRKVQLKSRLRLQWEHRNLLDLHCWFGLARTTAAMVIPVGLLRRVKRAVMSS